MPQEIRAESMRKALHTAQWYSLHLASPTMHWTAIYDLIDHA